MDQKLSNSSYEIAQVSDHEEHAIKKAESFLKKETGKDYILIAWQKEDTLN